MTKLLFFYILLFCSFPAFGETILLRGKIVDQKKNPVGSAYVEVQNDNSQIIGYTLSDTLGFFTMGFLPNQNIRSILRMWHSILSARK